MNLDCLSCFKSIVEPTDTDKKDKECSSCFKPIVEPTDTDKKDKECSSCFKSIVEPTNTDKKDKDKDLEDFNIIHILDNIVIINNDTEKEKENETDKNKLICPIVIDEMYCK